MVIQKILVIAALIAIGFAAPAQASTDPYNSYLWNRENALAQNGLSDRRDWYEWWYFKVVDPQSRDAYFFTYGVVNPWDTDHSLGGTMAVLQAGDFQRHIVGVNSFPVAAFAARYDRTEIHIGDNLATDKHLIGNIRQNGHDLAWNLSAVKQWRFNAMGWVTQTSDLSGIYWYPAQASATMTGWVRVDGITHFLREAPAYQDRNWGRSFPKWWTWLTSNHFDNSPGTALAAGGGQPEVLNSVYLFSGLCIGMKHQGQEYIFRTVDMDNVKFDIRWGVWNVVAENSRGQRIEISAYAPPSAFLLLPFQSPRGPQFNDYETLLGHMTVKLYRRSGIFMPWHQIADLETKEAGIEWGSPNPVQFLDLFRTQTTFQ